MCSLPDPRDKSVDELVKDSITQISHEGEWEKESYMETPGELPAVKSKKSTMSYLNDTW